MNDDALKKFLEQVTVLPDDEYQKNLKEGAILLCCLKGNDSGEFPDNLTGKCIVCDREIVFRPYNVAATTKVCIPCGMAFAQMEIQ